MSLSSSWLAVILMPSSSVQIELPLFVGCGAFCVQFGWKSRRVKFWRVGTVAVIGVGGLCIPADIVAVACTNRPVSRSYMPETTNSPCSTLMTISGMKTATAVGTSKIRIGGDGVSVGVVVYVGAGGVADGVYVGVLVAVGVGVIGGLLRQASNRNRKKTSAAALPHWL